MSITSQAVGGRVVVWAEKVTFDIGLPDSVMPEFCRRVAYRFGGPVERYQYPPDMVSRDGKAVYSCLGSEQAGYHATITVDKPKEREYLDFLTDFCRELGLDLSPLNG